MGGFFGAVSRRDVVLDLFFGVDYHSHLGTRNAGMALWDAERGFQRQIHGITNTPFRTKFEKDLVDFRGCCGIGCMGCCTGCCGIGCIPGYIFCIPCGFTGPPCGFICPGCPVGF